MLYQRSEPLKTERELLSKTIYYCRMGRLYGAYAGKTFSQMKRHSGQSK